MKLVHYSSNNEVLDLYRAVRRMKDGDSDYSIKIETLNNISLLIQPHKYEYQELFTYADVINHIESFLEDVFELYSHYKKCDCVSIIIKCGVNIDEYVIIK